MWQAGKAGSHVPRGTENRSDKSHETYRSKIPADALGNSCDKRNTSRSVRFARQISGSPNSASTCRHAPQGEIGTAVSATTATASITRQPAAMAVPTATRSAQFVRP